MKRWILPAAILLLAVAAFVFRAQLATFGQQTLTALGHLPSAISDTLRTIRNPQSAIPNPQSPITVTVNGTRYERTVEPRLLLSDFIRHELGLTGTHVGCEHGVCGTCTVLLDGQPVRSCLTFAVQAHGHDVRTVEGLGTMDRLSPLQEAFRDAHALQCGFCTPGFLMTLTPFLEQNPNPTEEQIRQALSGNLCRCTGYQHIVGAVKLAAERMR
jgi:carbon-monoxide dehydrogenase small subunit